MSLQASTNARLLSEQAKLTDLNGELESLIGQQSVTIQAIAMETTEAGKQSQQKVLDSINEQIAAKRKEISAQEAVIEGIKLHAALHACTTMNENQVQQAGQHGKI